MGGYICENGTNPTNAVQISLDNIIEKNKVVVFSMNNCPFCRVAKNIIEKYTKNYKEEMYRPEYHNWIVAKTGRTSVPAVFINGDYVMMGELVVF